MRNKKKVSGKHNADWVLLGFQSPPEDKALAMIVAEEDGRNVKDQILFMIHERAKKLGICRDGKITPTFKDRLELYAARVRMNKKVRKSNAD